MTSRKALLISAFTPSLHDSAIPAEMEALHNFLCSPLGGAWEEDEITVIQQPKLKEIARAVEEMDAEYTITCFFGKGFPDEKGNHFLVLDGADFIQDTELLNRSPKQLVLIDDAGGTFPEETLENMFGTADLMKARAMYDRWIESCGDGQLIMHATEQATVSRPDKNAGLFTRKLLQVAGSVPSAMDRFTLKNIVTTGDETPNLLLEEGYEEGPAITWSKGNIRLPFAMALPLPVAMLPSLRNGGFSSGLSL